MTQKQIHQPYRQRANQNYVYTINRHHEGSEWMLTTAKPRKWSRRNEKALLFSSQQEAAQCIRQFFTLDEQSIVFIRTIRVGA